MSTNEEDLPARRGRPALPEAERKSTNLKFRTRAGIRERLEVAAAAKSKSVSEEVEWRIERSFDYESIDTAINEAFLRYMRVFFGEQHNAMAMAALAQFWVRAIDTADRRVKSSKKWYNDKDKQAVMIEVLQRGVRLTVNDAAHSERVRVLDKVEEAMPSV